MTNRQRELSRAWQAADTAWSAELSRLFGARAGDVRYTKTGEGLEGSALRAKYDAWKAAGEAYRLG